MARRVNEDGEVERWCPRCREWWPLDSEFWYYTRGQLHGWCKGCLQERNRLRREAGWVSGPWKAPA